MRQVKVCVLIVQPAPTVPNNLHIPILVLGVRLVEQMQEVVLHVLLALTVV